MAGSPRFTHLDDLPWQEVRRQRHGDRVVSVREKWLDFSPAFLSLYAKWDPGMIVQRARPQQRSRGVRARGRDDVRRRRVPEGHAHRARPGRHVRSVRRRPRRRRAVRGDDGRPSLVPGRPRRATRTFLAERGVEQLPNPPIDMPDWLADTPNLTSAVSVELRSPGANAAHVRWGDADDEPGGSGMGGSSHPGRHGPQRDAGATRGAALWPRRPTCSKWCRRPATSAEPVSDRPWSRCPVRVVGDRARALASSDRSGIPGTFASCTPPDRGVR